MSETRKVLVYWMLATATTVVSVWLSLVVLAATLLVRLALTPMVKGRDFK